MASLVPDAPDLNSNSSDSDQGQKRESVEKKEREKKRKREESTTSSSSSSSGSRSSSTSSTSSEEDDRRRSGKKAKEEKDDLRRESGNSSDRRQRQESQEQRSQRSVNGRDGQRSSTPKREGTQGSVGPFTLRSIIDSRSVANGNGEGLDDANFLSHKEYLLKKNELRNQLDERTEKLRISRNKTEYYKRMLELAEEEAKESKLKLEPFEQKIAIYEQRLAQAQDDNEELEERMKKRQVDHSRQLEEEKQKSLDALETMKRESSELERKLQRANEKIANLEKCVIDSDQQLLERAGELAEAMENLEHMRKRAGENEKCRMEFQKLKNAYTHQKQKNMRLEHILEVNASGSEERVPVEPMVSHGQNEHSSMDNNNQESFNSSHLSTSSGLDHHRSLPPTMPQSVPPRNCQLVDRVPVRESVALPLKSCLKNSNNGLQSGDQSRDQSNVSTRRLSEKAYMEAVRNTSQSENRDPPYESRDRHLQNGGHSGESRDSHLQKSREGRAAHQQQPSQGARQSLRAPLFQPYVVDSSASLPSPIPQHLSDRRPASPSLHTLSHAAQNVSRRPASPSPHTLSHAAQNVSRRPAGDGLSNQSTSSERSSAVSISFAQALSGGRVPLQSHALSSLSSSRVSHTPPSIPPPRPSIPRFPDTGIIDPYAIVPRVDEVPVGELNKFKFPVVQEVLCIEDDD